MELEQLSGNQYDHSGFGAGTGKVINETYKCPCGESKVYYEKDDIPGFRDKSIYTDCVECNEKYIFSRGNATLK